MKIRQTYEALVTQNRTSFHLTGKRVKGNWRLKKIDEWIPAGENKKVHQDKMIEFIKEGEGLEK